MPRILGVDYGRSRVGLAVSDPMGRTAQPLEVVVRPKRGSLVQEVLRVAERVEAAGIVVGLPLRLDGTPGVEAEAARGFADSLRERSGLPVVLWDERLSTVQASRGMRAAGVSERRQRGVVDKVAAAVILGSYLESRSMNAAGPDEAALPTLDEPAPAPGPDETTHRQRAPRGAKRRRQALRPSRKDWLDDIDRPRGPQ